MAVGSGARLTQLERTWLMTRVTGSTPSMPLNQLRRLYYAAQVGGTFTTINDYQKRWLRKIITDNGGTPSVTINTRTLLKEALVVLSLRVSAYEADNWQTLYRGYDPA